MGASTLGAKTRRDGDRSRARDSVAELQDARGLGCRTSTKSFRFSTELIELGERQINAIARNYYLSSAIYLLKDLPQP